MNPWRRGGGVGRTGAPPLAAGARPAAAQAGRPAGATRGRVVGTAYVKRAGYTHRLPPSRIIHGGAWYGCWGTHAARQRPGAALVAEWVSARVDRRTPEAALLTITVNPATVLDRPVAASGRLTPPRGDRGVGGSGWATPSRRARGAGNRSRPAAASPGTAARRPGAWLVGPRATAGVGRAGRHQRHPAHRDPLRPRTDPGRPRLGLLRRATWRAAARCGGPREDERWLRRTRTR